MSIEKIVNYVMHNPYNTNRAVLVSMLEEFTEQGEGGGGTAPSSKQNDVTFIDYDGSVLYSYSLAEAQALTALPALPTHDGLVCQGWNWTLEDIKTLNRPVTVGAMYITDDGATRLHIRIETVRSITVPLSITQTVANGVSIDWGDGSAAETLPDTGILDTSHTYADAGDYIISLMPDDGCELSFHRVGSLNNKVYRNMLQDIFIGKNVTYIDNQTFQNYYSLASITIPNSVTSIGSNAFDTCYSLANVTIPNSVTSISEFTFQNCESLESVIIPNSVTSIGNNAFFACYSLESVIIPNSVTSIGTNAFDTCYSLASITISNSVTSINNHTFQNCYSLANVTIPNSVTSIGNYAFKNCHSLASITIPNSVTSIGINAFQSCYSLASITIPNSVTSIRDIAFQSCYSLANVTIPNSVTSIGLKAFQYCDGVRYYDFSACTSVPTLSNTNAFSDIPSDCQMLIPSALYDEWKAATNWATYASKMVAV